MKSTKRHPLISIVTVVFNASSTIRETIESVLSQKGCRIEYVIVDGLSTDGTVNILKEYDHGISRWISEPDKGVYDAMNKGIDLCHGDWIYFLGADDVLYDDQVVASVTRAISSDHEIIYGNVLFKHTKRIYDGKFDDFKMVTRNICHQSIFYPINVFTSFRFNPDYKVYADYHLNLILFRDKRWVFKYIKRTIAIFSDLGMSGRLQPDLNFARDFEGIVRHHYSTVAYLYRRIRTFLSLFR